MVKRRVQESASCQCWGHGDAWVLRQKEKQSLSGDVPTSLLMRQNSKLCELQEELAASWKKERFQIPFCFESDFRIHTHHTFLLPLEAKKLVPGPTSGQRQTEDESLSSLLLSNTIPTCWDQRSTIISYRWHNVKLFFLKLGGSTKIYNTGQQTTVASLQYSINDKTHPTLATYLL